MGIVKQKTHQIPNIQIQLSNCPVQQNVLSLANESAMFLQNNEWRGRT